MESVSESPRTWRDRQKIALRQELYDTALALFAEQGFDATTVQQITERAGVAKGTFFNHFPSKEHVVAQWYNGITESALAHAKARKTASACEAIGALFADMSGQATSEPELLIAKSTRGTDPLLMAAERAQVDALLEYLREQLADARDCGELSADLEIEPFCGLLVAVLTGTSRAWVYTDPRFDFPTVIRSRVDFLFGAIHGPHPNA